MNSLIFIIYAIIPLILAITLHEAAHAWMAHKCGDNTAFKLGRVTLNPIKHIDPLGTIVLPIITVMFTGFLFGWAKPVPVQFGNLRRPREDSILVAAAGPATNLLMAVGFAVLYFLIPLMPFEGYEHLLKVAIMGVTLNISFMIINLLPILPLDGGRIVAGLLPPKLGDKFSQLEPYGMIILILLLVTGFYRHVFGPLITGMTNFFLGGQFF